MRQLQFKFLCSFLIICLLAACDVSPVAIEYHEDQCSACKMTIADFRFGAELVTKKGKIYKFDATECLVREINKKGEDLYQFVMVTDVNQPKKLIDARTAFFLISKKLPSPMGANLSSYASEAAAKTAFSQHGGQLFSWEELKKQGQLQ